MRWFLTSRIAVNKYGRYCVPRSSQHRPAARAVLAGKIWEPKTVAFLCGLSGDLVHAGTYFGDFLPALERSRSEDALLWAFEPNRENYRCAVATAELNDLRKLRLMNAGLGKENCRLPIITRTRRGRALGGMSHIVDRAPGIFDRTALIVKLDDVVPAERQIAAIQLDIEGFEQKALAGALGIIRRCRPVLILETALDPGWVAENLALLGYAATGNIEGNTVYRT
jgi:FkbM family methyltransferase